MTREEPIVYIVDDDIRIREALSELLASHGMRTIAFATARDYVNSDKPDSPACIILDIELPDINGLDLQSELANEQHPPIVFLTGHGNIRSSVRAKQDGAIDFLTKPFVDTDLMSAIRKAIIKHRMTRSKCAEIGVLKCLYHGLTPRERDVFHLVVSGLSNKQAAAHLGISEVTLQIQKRKVMQKMKAPSLADLVRIAERLAVPITHSRMPGLNARASHQSRVVAVVDNDRSLLESLEDLLESEGYFVRTFSSAESLLARGVSELDLLITDISMPGMDGIALRDLVNNLRPGLPVFLITGRHEYSAQGLRNCFRKPFDAKALLAAIAQALDDNEVNSSYEG